MDKLSFSHNLTYTQGWINLSKELTWYTLLPLQASSPNKLTKPQLLLSCSSLLQGVQDATQTTIFITRIPTQILHNPSIRPHTSEVPKCRTFHYLTIATINTCFGVTQREFLLLQRSPVPKPVTKFQQNLSNFEDVFQTRFKSESYKVCVQTVGN